ncbi:MAG TPA: mechanosensitive ion channel domain-containing protein [Phycisphaerales bacterium]|nr:mechanosensitive ion channel domain-containing protein [Phycisphaerales bacterium]
MVRTPPAQPHDRAAIGAILPPEAAGNGATWALVVVAMLIGVALGALVLHAVVFFIASKAAKRTPFDADEILVEKLRGPSRVVLPALAVQFALPAMDLPPGVLQPVRHGLSLVLIIAFTWLAIQLVRAGGELVTARYNVGVADNLRARRVHTQLRVLVRIAAIVLAVVGVGVALTTFPAIRQLGASILASAGIAGIIIGFAAQKVLGNFLAGLQIAFAGHVHLDDVVVIDGEFGRVEEITTTYVVVKIWDERRMIVPFTRIIDQPFTNWTRETSQILGTVFLHADYSLPIQPLRDELDRVVSASPHWDGRLATLVVTDARPDTLQLRALVSAPDGSKQFDLCCEVREKLISFIQREYPECLPHTRVDLTEPRPRQPQREQQIAAEAAQEPEVPTQPPP